MIDEKFIPTRRTILVTAICGFALVLCWFIWWRGAPQIGGSEEAYQNVDALFTAIRAKDTKRLRECEQRLHALKDAGELPNNVSVYLDGIIEKARAGKWRKAAEKLYAFMRDQRRPSA